MGNCFRGASLKTPAAPSPASDKINCPILNPILRFSVKIVSDMVPKHLNSVQHGTIHFGSGGPKFGDLHRTSWPQTPKIWCSRYETSVPISWGPRVTVQWIQKIGHF